MITSISGLFFPQRSVQSSKASSQQRRPETASRQFFDLRKKSARNYEDPQFHSLIHMYSDKKLKQESSDSTISHSLSRVSRYKSPLRQEQEYNDHYNDDESPYGVMDPQPAHKKCQSIINFSNIEIKQDFSNPIPNKSKKLISSNFLKEKHLNFNFPAVKCVNKRLRKIHRIEDVDQTYIKQYQQAQIHHQLQLMQEEESNMAGIKKEKISSNFLEGHQISPYHRSKMVNRMLQIFHQMKKSEPQTFFASISIMDQFFHKQQKMGKVLNVQDMHLYGLTSIFISSKLYDTTPISLDQIVNEAGHQKFFKTVVAIAEVEILKALSFKIQQETVFEQTIIQFKAFLLSRSCKVSLSKADIDEICTFLELICKASTYRLSLRILPLDILSSCIIKAALMIKSSQNALKLKRSTNITTSTSQNNLLLINFKPTKTKTQPNIFLKAFQEFESYKEIKSPLFVNAVVQRIINLTVKVLSGKFKFNTLLDLYPQYRDVSLKTDDILRLLILQQAEKDLL